jgi:hypothetical protein
MAGLPKGAFAPLLLTTEEAQALLLNSPLASAQSRGYLASDQLLIQGTTGEHELLPVDSAALRSGAERRLTFMLRKLPRHLTGEQVRNLMLTIEPIQDTFDLVYVPTYSGRSGSNRGYFFVNFKCTQGAALFVDLLAIKNVPDALCSCEVVFAHVQGKQNMLRRLAESAASSSASTFIFSHQQLRQHTSLTKSPASSSTAPSASGLSISSISAAASVSGSLSTMNNQTLFEF